MHRVMRVRGSGCALILAAGLAVVGPQQAQAQFGRPNPFVNPLLNPFVNPLFDQFGNPVLPIGNAAGNAGPQGVMRATSSLANPINFYQHGQITGVGPIRGTVRIYNQFGLMGQSQNDPLGMGNNNQQLPGQGATEGDDPPQGGLLHVNYAQMFLPNQQQVNGGMGGMGGGGGGRFGGFGGFGGGFGGGGGGFPGAGFGKGAFGNGGNGL